MSEQDMPYANIAVLLDAENVSPSNAQRIVATAEACGHVALKRAYGDWSLTNLAPWSDTLGACGFKAVHQPRCVSKKNSSDIALTVEAMDLLHQGIHDCFVLASGDSDFAPLAIRLRESGATVIGIGNAAAAVSLRAACDEFVVLPTSKTEFESGPVSAPAAKPAAVSKAVSKWTSQAAKKAAAKAPSAPKVAKEKAAPAKESPQPAKKQATPAKAAPRPAQKQVAAAAATKPKEGGKAVRKSGIALLRELLVQVWEVHKGEDGFCNSLAAQDSLRGHRNEYASELLRDKDGLPMPIGRFLERFPVQFEIRCKKRQLPRGEPRGLFQA